MIRHFRAQTLVVVVAALVLFASVACRSEDDGPVLETATPAPATAGANAFDASLPRLPEDDPAPPAPPATRTKDRTSAMATGTMLATQVAATAPAGGTAISPGTSLANATATARPATQVPRVNAAATGVPPARTPASGAPPVATTVDSPSPTPVPPTAAAVPATPTPIPPANPPSLSGPAVARMSIASLGVDHPIEQLATTDGGTRLDTPHNATGAIGWYQLDYLPALAVPGNGGSAMFSAHINYNGADGPFANLAGIASRAEIAVTMANGSVYRYQVFAKRGYVIDANYVTAERPLINMDELVYTPNRPPGDEWITLVTCSCDPGRIIVTPGSIYGDCVDRDVVVAKRVS